MSFDDINKVLARIDQVNAALDIQNSMPKMLEVASKMDRLRIAANPISDAVEQMKALLSPDWVRNLPLENAAETRLNMSAAKNMAVISPLIGMHEISSAVATVDMSSYLRHAFKPLKFDQIAKAFRLADRVAGLSLPMSYLDNFSVLSADLMRIQAPFKDMNPAIDIDHADLVNRARAILEESYLKQAELFERYEERLNQGQSHAENSRTPKALETKIAILNTIIMIATFFVMLASQFEEYHANKELEQILDAQQETHRKEIEEIKASYEELSSQIERLNVTLEESIERQEQAGEKTVKVLEDIATILSAPKDIQHQNDNQCED